MRNAICLGALIIGAGTVLTPLAAAQQPGTPSAWSAVEAAFGRKGAMQPGGVIKFGFPRTDLSVTVGGVTLKPALALGSWVAMKETGNGRAMAMGDLVLTEGEVAPVMSALQAGGIEQTALHNHLVGESPRVMYMHIVAHGDATKIAHAIHAALAASGTPLGSPTAATTLATTDLDTAAIARALGHSGTLNGGVYQVSVARSERITEMGQTVPPSMGVATGINFQATGSGTAAITGDFVLLGTEVNPVIRALRDHGIEVTAVHSHMIGEEPRLFFMHFWANADAVALATGLRAALEQTK